MTLFVFTACEEDEAAPREMYKDYYDQKNLIPKENLIEIKFEDFKNDSLSYLKKNS